MAKVWISVDVEPDISEHIEDPSLGLEEGLPKLLDLFDDLSAPVDFFVLGEVARVHARLIKTIVSRGHEVGSHGDTHRLLCTTTLRAQREQIERSVRAISNVTALPVRIFRAPNFSGDGNTIRVLEEVGIPYDSSVLPGRVLARLRVFKVYDHRRAPRSVYVPSKVDIDSGGTGLVLELPVTENPFQRGAPIGLGFLNSHSVQETVKALRTTKLDWVSFLIHPWEAVDLAAKRPDSPRWISKACSRNLAPLRDFLTIMKMSDELVTFESIARGMVARR